MRVVAGTSGGRLLKGPAAADARPTTDKVRGAMFNSLASAGLIEGASVVDLFAGTGACGIEALSRGARSVVFVEKARANAQLIKENLAQLQLQGEVHLSDAMRFVQGTHGFDLAIVDPPYAFDEWSTLLSSLHATVAVCESNRPLVVEAPWQLVRTKKYGGTVVTMLERLDIQGKEEQS